MVTVDPHPLLVARAFTTRFPRPLGELQSPEIAGFLGAAGPAGLTPPTDSLRAAIRDLLRHGGFKPTGRSKPASEYLIKAAEAGFLSPINAAVDACNALSLHSGFPISVVDLDRAKAPFRIGIAPPEATYVFNAGGQTIDIDGLLCLHDAEGPCANAVKDAQRTKTTPETTQTLSIVWGVKAYERDLDATVGVYRRLLEVVGAEVTPCDA